MRTPEGWRNRGSGRTRRASQQACHRNRVRCALHRHRLRKSRYRFPSVSVGLTWKIKEEN